METAQQVLVALARRYAFGDVAALVAAGAHGGTLTTTRAVQVRRLCAFGQQLLDLDAEDFGLASDAVPPRLRARALACRMPQAPQERHRGALGSLRTRCCSR